MTDNVTHKYVKDVFNTELNQSDGKIQQNNHIIKGL